MKNVFICFKTDTWHSYSSYDTIGVGTTLFEAIKICKAQAIKEGDKLRKEDTDQLASMNQTQGYKGEGEFVIQEIETNILL